MLPWGIETVPVKAPGVNIKRLRKARGWSQAELALRARLSSVKAIENGHRFGHHRSLEQIARALGVTVADLFTSPRRKRA